MEARAAFANLVCVASERTLTWVRREYAHTRAFGRGRGIVAAHAGHVRADAAELPGAGDGETTFGPGRAFVRRVSGRNVWILYRFDEEHVFAMTTRGVPPVPAD